MSCGDKNSLVREGASRLNRALAALSSGYARADERDTADLLLFAKEYAALLNYYPPDQEPPLNWQPLMKMDVSVTLAALMKTDTRNILLYKKLLYKKILVATDDEEAKKQFTFLFDLIFSLIRFIDEQSSFVPADMPYKPVISTSITGKLQYPFLLLAMLFAEFKTLGWTNNTITDTDKEAPVPVETSNKFNQSDLIHKAEWGIDPPVTVQHNITLPAGPVKENITYIIRHNTFNALVDQLLKGITEIKTTAAGHFEQTVHDYPTHSPHYALFLSFVKLFRIAQEHLNNYTQRHLDLYYKEVLQLANKTAEPDTAHLVMELQKPVQQHLLDKGTLFKGGKDSTGKETSYYLTDDIVLNKTSIAAIHSQQLMNNGRRLLAFPVAASADGQGAEINTADKSWFTFGDSKIGAFAQTGFAIASNILFLKEGTRTITVTVMLGEPITESGDISQFSCFSVYLTGEKDWHIISNVSATLNDEGDQLIFTCLLDADAPAIIPFSPKIHKEERAVELPLMKIILEQDKEGAIPYDLVSRKQVSSITVQVEVTNVKDLSLSHDAGSIDASKPFKPFGDFPDDGASFYIGSKEVFQKDLTNLQLNPDWQKNGQVFTSAGYLHQGIWNETINGTIINDNKLAFSPANTFIKSGKDFATNEPLTATTKEGFLRLRLDSAEFSLSSYMKKIQGHLNSISTEVTDDFKKTKFISDEAPPVPDEIILESFSLDYSAAETISFTGANKTGSSFIHITPFGYKNIAADTADTITLISGTDHEGELFIGLHQAAPGLVITILFQVAEGSSNPLKGMQTLQWSYMTKDNNWKNFENHFVIDGTKNLTQSGIVTLTLPSGISSEVTLLQKGLHWIKASVNEHTDAVCKMIAIKTQAAKVKLVQDETKQAVFREHRPSGSISKLVTGDAAIKTIGQPFDSHGGRIKEPDEHFYQRVSERLRHKQRAVSVWDYEHIILEKFPEIFKVKCLNHTGFYGDEANSKFCENYAGHVTLIPVPHLHEKTNIHPLRPYTPIGLLGNIREYLSSIISPFVKLHVKNPAFEEIQLDFKVKFHDNMDESFYSQLLNTEIEKFLCPWAWNTATEISFGGKIRKSSLLNFIEERPYVDHISCLKMNHVILRSAEIHIKELSDIEVAEGSTSRSVLVSYYNEENGKKHTIIPSATCEYP
ncbi:MAG: hypothetical protein JNK14_13495 [Chitinophagaceae bacterium]|nr:hypothetical protein [Chitinophagaceae bacterium]